MTADFNKILDDTYHKLLSTTIAKEEPPGSKLDKLESATQKDAVDSIDDVLLSKEGDLGLTSEAIEAVMDVLISRDVLLEPLQSLDKSYDEWASKSVGSETEERKVDIDKQRKLIKDIIKLFGNDALLSDGVKKDIFEKMQAIQELGMPPEEVAAKISDGGEDMMLPGNCSIM